MPNIEEKVEEFIQDKINELGYEIYDVFYGKEGKEYYLRIFIDHENGIDLDDCEKISNEVSDMLDEKDYIKEQYYLEVSSPGIERTLRKQKHFEKYIDSEIEVKLFKSIDNKKVIRGILKEVTNDDIKIIQQDKVIIINQKEIATAKTIYNW